VTVNGVDVETLHPGPAHAIGLRPEHLAMFIDLFPHITRLSDFGSVAAPRLRLSDLELVTAA
jgi:hypothetical protein